MPRGIPNAKAAPPPKPEPVDWAAISDETGRQRSTYAPLSPLAPGPVSYWMLVASVADAHHRGNDMQAALDNAHAAALRAQARNEATR